MNVSTAHSIANISGTMHMYLGKLVMMLWRELKAEQTSSWLRWMVSRDSRSSRSSRLIPSGMMRGMAITHVLSRSSLGFTTPLQREREREVKWLCKAGVTDSPQNLLLRSPSNLLVGGGEGPPHTVVQSSQDPIQRSPYTAGVGEVKPEY